MTKAEAAYQEVRNRIINGSLAPGSVLEQEVLASSLGLSTTPVREALRRLEAEQLVTLQAHRQVRVAPLSPGELEQLYTVRFELDPLAAALAAKKASDEQLAATAALLGLPGTPEERLRVNRALHRSIYAVCQNAVLIQILDSLWDRCDRYRMVLVATESVAREAEKEHVAIVEAFRRRDARTLRRLLREHLQESARQIKDVVGTTDRPLWDGGRRERPAGGVAP